MRKGTITDLQGQPLGTIIEADDGTVTGQGKGETLVEQAPGKSLDDWIRTVHHSTYLRITEDS